MSGYLHINDQQRFIDATGKIVAVTIYFYLTGTTVLAPIYQDKNLSVPMTNPVLVAAGQAIPSIFLDTAVTYRRRIVYPDGYIYDIDPYDLGGVSTFTGPNGSSSVNFKATEIGALSRSLSSRAEDLLSILDFIPVALHATIRAGTSTDDHTSYITLAANTGRSLFFPAGKYNINGTISLARGQMFKGDGRGNADGGGTHIAASTRIYQTQVANVATFLLNTAECVLENMIIYGPTTSAPFYSYGVQIGDTTFSGVYTLRNVSTLYCNIGLRSRGSLWTECYSCRFENGTYGLAFDHQSPTYSTSTTFYSCVFKGNQRGGVTALAMPVRSVVIGFYSCNVEDNCVENPTGYDQFALTSAGHVTIQGCYFEDNKATKSDGINLNGISECTITNNYFNSARRHIYATSSSYDVWIACNRFIGTSGTNAVDLSGAANFRCFAISNETDKPILIPGATSSVITSAIAQIVNDETPFTPTIRGSGTAGTPTYTAQSGRYSRLGNRVFFDLRVSITAKGGMVGNISIAGLPVARAAYGGVPVLCTVEYEGITLAGGRTQVTAEIVGGATAVDLYQVGSALAQASITDTAIADSTTIFLSGNYSV